jgi:hypothetical protein
MQIHAMPETAKRFARQALPAGFFTRSMQMHAIERRHLPAFAHGGFGRPCVQPVCMMAPARFGSGSLVSSGKVQ